MSVNNDTTLKELLNECINRVNTLNYGELFILEELFQESEWRCIDGKKRTKLGFMFSKYVHDNKYIHIYSCGKTFKNQNKYMKQR